MRNDGSRRPVGPISPRHNFGKFGGQYSFGQKPNGGEHDGVWHTGSDFTLWSGYWPSNITPGELHKMCKSIVSDLEIAYPSLRSDDDEQ